MRNICFFFLPLLSLACVDAARDEPTDRTRDAVATSADASHDSDKDDVDPCALVLCAPGHACELDCNGDAACNPVVCEGFAGWTCAEGFDCVKSDASLDASQNADEGGKCVKDCSGDSCGKCLSSDDCGPNAKCSTSWGECLSWCDCPECDVCAGQCVPITDPACGECTSDQDCKNGQICSVGLGDCLSSCDCPACDVCAGSCVDPANQ